MSAVPIRLFLLDDHELVRRGLKDSIEEEGDLEIVGEAGTLAEGIAGIESTRPDVAILDVRLPDGSGVDVCRSIRQRHPSVHCLMLTSFPDDEALIDAILAGASGYILKETRVSELIEDIRRIASGESLLDPRTTSRVFARLRRQQQDDRFARLSEQERAILDLIGKGLTNREIAHQLHLAEQTVKNYISRLLGKLGVDSRTQAALLVAGRAQPSEGV